TEKALEEKGWLDRVTFPENAFHSPGWEKGSAAWEKKASELMAREDLDLVIGMGTDAAKALLKKNNQKTPILGMGVSDALGSGLIETNEDSGVDNFTVRIVPGRYKRMFEIFHQVVGFEKLGLIYPDTESGGDYTNLESAREVAEAKGFDILEQEIESEEVSAGLAGLEALVERGMDAFFIPSLLCFDWEKADVDKLFTFLREKNIPTFARNGSRDVQAGALMGFSTIDFSKRGAFLADKIIRILEGESPGDLPMKDDAVPIISLNIHVAEQIGFNPPFDILAATDEIYREITLPVGRLVK
ncbi:MAG: ABC transporter substrate binding protein, partial [Desulfobacteraceae bacterium]